MKIEFIYFIVLWLNAFPVKSGISSTFLPHELLVRWKLEYKKHCHGRLSSGKKTKHIKAKFFFIKDRVDDGKIKVIDCPTEEMWADILTKPLQGMAFRTMSAVLMNCPVNYKDAEEKITIKKATKTNANHLPTKKTVS